jgi:DNA-binding MarR family transcriptional regulator/N-acetylglutamate synthase-like GNAT family acetyltransferase
MRVDAVRRFNRFYTRRIGALRADFAGSPYPLPEARLIYELGRRRRCTAAELGRELDLDAGYLSRLVASLKRRGVLQSRRSLEDARASVLSLTDAGRRAFALLDSRSREEVASMLGALAKPDQSRLVGAMQAVQGILEGKKSEIVLREHRPGDMGWVVQAHGELYAREYGWDERFEALVSHIAAEFVEKLDPARERCWIAEMGGEPVGCVFVVKQSASVAKLRLLLVEPRARGRGLGRRLVEECIAFARARGYRKLVLWTQANLLEARRLYKASGFRLAKSQAHAEFGVKLVGEYWELKLRP